MTPNSIIVTEELTRRFGDTLAVDRLTLEVYPGEIFGFLGHNGAGKTTTVRLLNGILTPNNGKVRVLGLDPEQDGPALRRRTGVLTETPSLDERLTGRDNLRIYADLYDVPRSEVNSRVESLLETFELTERADDKVGGYSKGMKQRLALARALIHNPEILFLDEPTSGLDPVAARRVHRLITDMSHREGHMVFLCTHNLAEAQQLCDRVAVLEQGHMVALGTPTELAHQLGRSLRLEIEVASATSSVAIGILGEIVGSKNVIQENGLITLLGANREMIPGLITELVAAEVRIYRVTPQEPTLEDVYFALHGEREVLA